MQRWEITSDFQFWMIMLAFSLAGSSVVWIRKPIFAWLGVGPSHPGWLKFLLWLAVVFPSYQVLLMLWGTLLGQFRFFWKFEQRTLRALRILPRQTAPQRNGE
jgi:hypothetical protein